MRRCFLNDHFSRIVYNEELERYHRTIFYACEGNLTEVAGVGSGLLRLLSSGFSGKKGRVGGPFNVVPKSPVLAQV